MRRVLVTGSRDWVDTAVIVSALNSEIYQFPEGIIVVHGGAEGADKVADQWAWVMRQAGYPVRPEAHRPDYDRYPAKFAPLRRNELMASLGAGVCHAFPLEGGTGTRHCMTQAFANEIRVVNHGFQPYTQQAKDYAEAYLSRRPKTQKAYL